MKDVGKLSIGFKLFALLEAILYIALGILFIVLDASVTKSTVLYVFGGILILSGTVHFVRFIFSYRVFSFNLLKGAAEIITGILLIILIPRLKEINLFGIAFGIYFIITSVLLLQLAIDGKRLSLSYWWVSLASAIVLLSVGVVLIFVKAAENVLTTIIGVTIILDALFSVVTAFIVSDNADRYSGTLKDIFNDK